MTKHYKAFGFWILTLLILTGLALVLRYHFSEDGPQKYHGIVYRYATEYRLDPTLVMAVIRVESNFDPHARSKANAIGLMQITEETLKWAILREGKSAAYTAEDLYKPEINIKYGCLILSLLSEELKDQNTILAAYNAGRGNALKWLKDRRYSPDGITLTATPYKETNQYIKKVQKYYKQYKEKLGEAP